MLRFFGGPLAERREKAADRRQCRRRGLDHHHVAGVGDHGGGAVLDQAPEVPARLGEVMRSSAPITTRDGQRIAAACSVPAA